MVILVTGANGGIGQATVEALRRDGHQVLATDVGPDGRPPYRPLDVREADHWQGALDEILERWGRLDVLINLAGVAQAGHFVDLDASAIDHHIDINLKGAALGMHTVLPTLLARGSGHLINVGSLASTAAVPGIALYSATKFALRGLSLALSTELAGTGVAVSLVHPDLVDTPMITDQIDQPEAAVSFSGSRTLTPEEVAEVLAGRVLRERPLEIYLPWTRGLLARAAGTQPRLSRILAPLLRRQGERRQARLRRERGER